MPKDTIKDFLDLHFGERRWCRRLIGGRWQRWFVRVIGSAIWIRVPLVMPAHVRPPGTLYGDVPLDEERW